MKLYAGTTGQFRADEQWLLDNNSALYEADAVALTAMNVGPER